MAIRKCARLTVREQVSDRQDIHEVIDLSLCLRSEGMTIGQIADTSGRRGETRPLEYLKYNQASESVLHLHNIMNWRLKLTIWGDSMLHALAWPVYRLYNFEQERLEFRYLFPDRKVESCRFTSSPSSFADHRRFEVIALQTAS